MIGLSGWTKDNFRMYTVGNVCTEIDNDQKLLNYCKPLKNLNKSNKDEFLFDLKDVIVISIFSSDKYMLIKFD